jgi:hypothetical protein
MRCLGRLITAALICFCAPTTGVAEERLPLHVLYVGNASTARADNFAGLLKQYFARVTVANRIGFKPDTAASADVVLLDWSQTETAAREATSPFGKLEEWHKPTVLMAAPVS